MNAFHSFDGRDNNPEASSKVFRLALKWLQTFTQCRTHSNHDHLVMTDFTLDVGLEDFDHSRFSQLLIDRHPLLSMIVPFLIQKEPESLRTRRL
jgi:hypothetical protein